jgi:hypothetical protein
LAHSTEVQFDRNAYKQISPLVLGFGEKKLVQSCYPGLDGQTIYEVVCEFKDDWASSQHLLQQERTLNKDLQT